MSAADAVMADILETAGYVFSPFHMRCFDAFVRAMRTSGFKEPPPQSPSEAELRVATHAEASRLVAQYDRAIRDWHTLRDGYSLEISWAKQRLGLEASYPSLEPIHELAITENNAIEAARSRVRMAAAREVAARSGYWRQLDEEEGGGWVFDPHIRADLTADLTDAAIYGVAMNNAQPGESVDGNYSACICSLNDQNNPVCPVHGVGR